MEEVGPVLSLGIMDNLKLSNPFIGGCLDLWKESKVL